MGPISRYQQSERARLWIYSLKQLCYTSALSEELSGPKLRLLQIDRHTAFAVIATPLAVTILEDLKAFDSNDGHPSLDMMSSSPPERPAFILSIQASRSWTSYSSSPSAIFKGWTGH